MRTRETTYEVINEPWSEHWLPDCAVIHARAVVKSTIVQQNGDGRDIVDERGLPLVNVHTEVQIQAHTKPVPESDTSAIKMR
jgi:hypothetical protein